MRVSEIQKRRHLPESEQPVPTRRVAGWLIVAVAIAFGVFLYFRYSADLAPLLH